MMQFTAAQIAELIKASIEGDAEQAVTSFGKIEEAIAGQLSFLANPKYEEFLYTTGASVVIVNDDLALKQPVAATLLRVPNAYGAFAELLHLYAGLRVQHLTGIEPDSFISPQASVGKDAYVAAFAYVSAHAQIGDNVKIFPGAFIGENVKIGDNSIVNANVSIYHDCVVGANVILHAGVVVGADGFGFAPQEDGTYAKIPQIGNVVIDDNVEVGANTAIDRATIGSTHLHKGVKVDNLVQVAHNVEIGENTVMAAQSGISGSTKLGRHVMIGGQAGIVGHLHVADYVRINAQSGVTKSIDEPKSAVTGTPAFAYTAALRSQALARELPQMEKRLWELEQKIAALTAK